MKKRLMLLVVVTAFLAATVPPAAAVTRGGSLDGGAHPYVGIMVAKIDGTPVWRCSGTLITDNLYVTAGHCTFGATSVEIWFDTDLMDQGGPGAAGYPFTGEVSGTPYTLPGHTASTWFLYDLGVVVLDDPVDLGPYPVLPDVGQLDALAQGRKSANVTAVGYGLQEFVEGPLCVGPEDCEGGNFFDPKIQSDLTRYKATLMVVNSQGVAGLGNITKNNPELAGSFLVSGDAKHGGTCFGDSGGPMLMGNVLVGVNSFALNRNCAGTGGAFRVDQPTSLAFIEEHLD
jgi:hypothetical protein